MLPIRVPLSRAIPIVTIIVPGRLSLSRLLKSCHLESTGTPSLHLLVKPCFHGLDCHCCANDFCFLFLWLQRRFSSPGCLLPVHWFNNGLKGGSILKSLNLCLSFNSPRYCPLWVFSFGLPLKVFKTRLLWKVSTPDKECFVLFPN